MRSKESGDEQPQLNRKIVGIGVLQGMDGKRAVASV